MTSLNWLTVSKKKSKSEEVYDYIKEQIRIGQLNDGDIITEQNIASIFNISRTPVKKALIQLELENYVKCLDGIGHIVTGLSYSSLLDMYEVRSLLEVLALKRAFTNIPIDEIDRLEGELEEILHECRKGKKFDSEAVVQIDSAVHNLFIKQSVNIYVKNLIGTLESQIERYRYKAYQCTDTVEESARQHLEILHYIEVQDLNKAVKLLEKHIKWSFNSLDEALFKRRSG